MKFTEKYVKRIVAVVVMTALVSGTVLFSVAGDGTETGREATTEDNSATVTTAETEMAGVAATESATVTDKAESAATEEEVAAETEEPEAEEPVPKPEAEEQPEETESSAEAEEAGTESEASADKADTEASEQDQPETASEKEDSSQKDAAQEKAAADSSKEDDDEGTAEATGSAYVIPRNNRQRKYQMKEDNVVLTGDYNQDGMEDLFVIQQSDTKSEKVEIHILSGESNYYSYIDVIRLDLEAGAGWTFLLAEYEAQGTEAAEEAQGTEAVLDLYAICSDEEKTTLYVFDGKTGYEEVLLEAELPIPDGSDQELTFLAGDADDDQVTDLYIISAANTQSGHVEVTVLDGAKAYQEILAETVTAFELPDEEDETEVQFDFGLADYNEDGGLDLYMIQKTGTQSGKVEVSILAAADEAPDDTEAADEAAQEEVTGVYRTFLEERKATHLDLPEQEAKFIVPQEAVNIQVFYTDATKSGCVEGYLMAYRGAATISEGAYLEALRYEGKPYVWGGESLVNGVDCSGLVKVIYEKFDVHMAHSSLLMRYAGTSVDKSDLQIGDLLCYDGHIGFYAGDGKLYSALGTKYGIRYNSAYYKSILTIRRIK